jgi:hypothetical protein
VKSHRVTRDSKRGSRRKTSHFASTQALLAGVRIGRIWLVTFMDYDLGYFDDETCRLEPIANPFGPKVLPMSPK